MADPSTCPPLTPASILSAHSLISSNIHHTPLISNRTLNTIACQPLYPGEEPPKVRLFFKCENEQKIGAFKARGAYHAIERLVKEMGLEEVRKRGVATHSSGMSLQVMPITRGTNL